MYPRIAIAGDASERGRQYGESARERVQRSVAAYDEAFAHYARWDRRRVREEAATFRAPIAAHGQRYLDEIRGIAEGAAVDEIDILAINVRTEIMFAAEARNAENARRLPPECSAFAALSGRSGGPLLIGQTWDWLAHAFDTVVVIEARQSDAPNYVTVVEAGLLAKAGMNSAGVALATNALVSDADAGSPGVPYHVLLRSILDAETVSEALAALQRAAAHPRPTTSSRMPAASRSTSRPHPATTRGSSSASPKMTSCSTRTTFATAGSTAATSRSWPCPTARSGWHASTRSCAPTEATSISPSGPRRSRTMRCSRSACAVIRTRARRATRSATGP